MQSPIKSFVEFWSVAKVSPGITKIHSLLVLFSLSKEWLAKNPSIVKVAVTEVPFLWAAEEKKITKNQDKYAENYSADADLFVLMGNFLEDTLCTLLAYSFSFVLLLAVTSQFFQFHLTDFSFPALAAELIWEEKRRKEKRQCRKKSACEKVQECNLKIWYKLSPWLIFLAFLSSSTHQGSFCLWSWN